MYSDTQTAFTSTETNRRRQPWSESFGSRVLILEENEDTQCFLSRLLSELAIDINFVRGGQECVEEIRRAVADEEPYDIVVFDVTSEESEGMDSARAVRDFGYEGVLIALVRDFCPEGRQACLDAGFDHVLAKSSLKRTLARTLKLCLES